MFFYTENNTKRGKRTLLYQIKSIETGFKPDFDLYLIFLELSIKIIGIHESDTKPGKQVWTSSSERRNGADGTVIL